MARQDIDIKSDIISELEDIDVVDDLSLLDLLMVESVHVDAGVASVTLVVEGGLSASTDELVERIKDNCRDLEGVEAVAVRVLTRDELEDLEGPLPLSGKAFRNGTNGVASTPPSVPSGTEGVLTLDALLQSIPPDESPQEGTEADGMTLYSGGGCGAGTLAIASDTPVTTVAETSSKPVTAPPASNASIADGTITIPLTEYRELLTEVARLRGIQAALKRLLDSQ